jgi:hypothetical protein
MSERQDDSFESDPELNRAPHFDELAIALGYLSFRYAGLEDDINSYIFTIFQHSELTRAVIDHSGDNLDRRLTFVEKLCHMVEMPQPWLDDFQSVSGGIKRNILPRRNRFVHDSWAMMDEIRWEQRYLRLALKKAQADERKSFSPIKRTETTAAAIWEVAQAAYDAAADVSILHHDLFHWVKSKRFDDTFGKYRRQRPRRYRT